MTPIFNINKEQIKKIALGMVLTMVLSGLAYLAQILPDITPNPLVLTIFVGLVKFLQEYLTDEQGKLGGIL